MSRQPPTKKVGNYDNATSLPAGTFVDAALLAIDSSGNILTEFGDVGSFEINPDTYDETHATGWVGNQIPGQSLPVYQWVAGGPRIISFEALVTKDSSYFNRTASSALAAIGAKAINAVGSIASNFLGAPLPLGQIVNALTSTKSGTEFDFDISPILQYYRSLWKPTYNSNKVVQSPPLVYLYSGTTFEDYPDSDTISSSSNIFVVTNLGIKIIKQLPDLTPMEAIVSFQLEQYPITSVGNDSSGTSSSIIASATNFASTIV